MFGIFTMRQIGAISFILCCVFLLGAGLNGAAVASAQPSGAALRIIMYHQISENSKLWGDYVIPLDLLEKDFQYMKENGIQPISFKSLQDYVSYGKELPEKSVLITFDDGERSFLTKVLSILEKYGYPANVNIVGALTMLYTENGDTDDRYAYLNIADVERLWNHPLVEVGCHSYNMHSLGSRRGMGKKYSESDTDYKNALQKDFALFEEHFGKYFENRLKILAYPYGIRTAALRETAYEKGFEITLTCEEKVNFIQKGGTLRELGRYNRAYGMSSEEFFGELGF